MKTPVDSTARACRCGVLAAALVIAAASVAAAQSSSTGIPNAVQGFSENRGKPVHIEATTLVVRDKQKIATFTGNVKVVQGDTTMRCKSLVVYYEAQKSEGTVPAASPGPGGAQQIRRLDALGGVTVTQRDQTATGDTGVFDMLSNTVTLTGNVVVSQGPNVMRGDRLVVDLTTGVSRVDASRSRGPVRMLIHQKSQQSSAPPASPTRIGPPRSLTPN
jgi:lipopolysaccharide export system protein LptA